MYKETAPATLGMDEYIKIKKIQNVFALDPATGNYVHMKDGSEFYLSLNGIQINIDFKPYRIVQGTWPEFIGTIEKVRRILCQLKFKRDCPHKKF